MPVLVLRNNMSVFLSLLFLPPSKLSLYDVMTMGWESVRSVVSVPFNISDIASAILMTKLEALVKVIHFKTVVLLVTI